MSSEEIETTPDSGPVLGDNRNAFFQCTGSKNRYIAAGVSGAAWVGSVVATALEPNIWWYRAPTILIGNLGLAALTAYLIISTCCEPRRDYERSFC